MTFKFVEKLYKNFQCKSGGSALAVGINKMLGLDFED